MSTNFPQCYTSVKGSLTNHKILVLMEPTVGVDCQSLIDPRTSTIQIQVALIGATENYVLQTTIEAYNFSTTSLVYRCTQDSNPT